MIPASQGGVASISKSSLRLLLPSVRIPAQPSLGRKLLTRLASTGTPPHVNPGADRNARQRIVDGMTFAIPEPSEFSPMDMDLGPFLAGGDWDVFTQSLGQDYLGLPFHEETL